MHDLIDFKANTIPDPTLSANGFIKISLRLTRQEYDHIRQLLVCFCQEQKAAKTAIRAYVRAYPDRILVLSLLEHLSTALADHALPAKLKADDAERSRRRDDIAWEKQENRVSRAHRRSPGPERFR